MSSVETILFDLGEVTLCGMMGVEKSIAPHVNAPEPDVWKHVNGKKLRRLFIGKSSEAEYWQQVIEEGRYPAEIGGIPAADFLMHAMRSNFREIEGTADIVRSLKKAGYNVGLISDHVREWVEYCKTMFPLDELFNTQCYSFDCGCTKKAAGSFTYALKRVGAEPESTLFVDDNSRNLFVAQQHPVNIRYVHQFTNAENLRAALPSYGIQV
ncbi:MAG: HAD hydrolase-like protein [Candidatus Aenigmarchaeota archaeon]|nr:HAD hydrolase-like protein [Candidatus Aenigmarchaeota archaeon]